MKMLEAEIRTYINWEKATTEGIVIAGILSWSEKEGEYLVQYSEP